MIYMPICYVFLCHTLCTRAGQYVKRFDCAGLWLNVLASWTSICVTNIPRNFLKLHLPEEDYVAVRQLRGDMQRLHFDLVRQLHQQQMEAVEVLQRILSRQDAMEHRLERLSGQVSKLLRSMNGMLQL